MRITNEAANMAVGVVALIHFIIASAEMFLWNRIYPRLKKPVDFNDAEAVKVAPVVANAGLYNGFVAAGLVWSALFATSPDLRLFFLACVMIAGVFGAATLKDPKVLGMQTLPAAIAACLVWFAHA